MLSSSGCLTQSPWEARRVREGCRVVVRGDVGNDVGSDDDDCKNDFENISDNVVINSVLVRLLQVDNLLSAHLIQYHNR